MAVVYGRRDSSFVLDALGSQRIYHCKSFPTMRDIGNCSIRAYISYIILKNLSSIVLWQNYVERERDGADFVAANQGRFTLITATSSYMNLKLVYLVGI